jgi:hypothetical protein
VRKVPPSGRFGDLALAERLGAATIATLDKRRFGVMRSRHVESFTLAP